MTHQPTRSSGHANSRRLLCALTLASLGISLPVGCSSSSSPPGSSNDGGPGSTPVVDGSSDSSTVGVACTPGSCAQGQTCCLTSATESDGAVAFSGVCAPAGTCPGAFSVACTGPAGCADAGTGGVCCASLTFPASYSLSQFLPPNFDLPELTTALDASTFDAAGFGLDIACQTSCSGSSQIQLCSSAAGEPGCPTGTVCMGASGASGAALDGVMGCIPQGDSGVAASVSEAGSSSGSGSGSSSGSTSSSGSGSSSGTTSSSGSTSSSGGSSSSGYGSSSSGSSSGYVGYGSSSGYTPPPCIGVGDACSDGTCCSDGECNYYASTPVCVDTNTCGATWQSVNSPGGACTTSADCCNSACPDGGGTCGGPSTNCQPVGEDGGACGQNSDCCSNQCNTGTTSPSGPVCTTSACSGLGGSCGVDSDCCSAACGNGTCAGGCNTLTNSASVVSWGTTDYAFDTPAGGTISNGTYYLESVTKYTDYPGGAVPSEQLTMTVTDGTMTVVQNEPNEGSYSGNETVTLSYTISGTTIIFTPTCQGASGVIPAFLEGATLGGTAPNYTYTASYTAYAGDELAVYGSVSEEPLLFELTLQ